MIMWVILVLCVANLALWASALAGLITHDSLIYGARLLVLASTILLGAVALIILFQLVMYLAR